MPMKLRRFWEMNEPKLSEMFAPITGDLIAKLCVVADKYNYDRDSFIQAFAKMFTTISEISTFENYGGNKQYGSNN